MASTPIAEGVGARDALRSVDQILEELDRLAATALDDADFYAAVMERLRSLGCSSAVIWLADPGGSASIAWQSSAATGQNGAHAALVDPSHQGAVAAAIASGQPRLIEKSGEDNGSKGSVHVRSIIAPWSPANLVHGALQVWFAEKENAAALSGYLQVLAAVGELVAMFFARQEQRRLRQRVERQSQVDAFQRAVHESLDLEQIAFRIANDGRVLLGCDRLAVAVRHGGRYKIAAISGADQVHRRSESMQHLERLCQIVVRLGEPLWHPATASSHAELPPQISDALSAYFDVSPAVALAALPLRLPSKTPGGAVGVLVLEQYERPFDPALPEQVRAVVEPSCLALANAERVSAIPGHKLWLALARPGFLSRWISRTLAVVVLLAAAIAALVAIPADVRIKARGELQPAVRQDVFAPRDGVVTSVLVDHGQVVESGQTLVEMRSPELELEMQRVAGELETARKRLAAAQSERLQTRASDTDARLRQRRLTAEDEQLQQQVRDLSDRQAMLQRELEALKVASPLAGEVVTWNVEQQLAARPLRRGDALLTVAHVAGPWQLELKVPSRSAGRLLAAGEANDRPVSFVLATSPGQTLSGAVKEIAPRLEIDESGASFMLVTVEVPHETIENRAPGASAFARIDCGRGTLAEAWFHELIDAARLWMPFW
jgi:multidrug efflux pump subunit AcrA (membrane-fusion protein)